MNSVVFCAALLLLAVGGNGQILPSYLSTGSREYPRPFNRSPSESGPSDRVGASAAGVDQSTEAAAPAAPSVNEYGHRTEMVDYAKRIPDGHKPFWYLNRDQIRKHLGLVPVTTPQPAQPTQPAQPAQPTQPSQPNQPIPISQPSGSSQPIRPVPVTQTSQGLRPVQPTPSAQGTQDAQTVILDKYEQGFAPFVQSVGSNQPVEPTQSGAQSNGTVEPGEAARPQTRKSSRGRQ